MAVEAQAIEAALEFAQVLHAGDDFLAGVAAFLEAYAADRLQVEHLRDEQLAGLGHDLADAGTNLPQQPGIEIAFGKCGGQLAAQGLGLRGGRPEFGAARGARMASSSSWRATLSVSAGKSRPRLARA
jgi:hypothetical protein